MGLFSRKKKKRNKSVEEKMSIPMSVEALKSMYEKTYAPMYAPAETEEYKPAPEKAPSPIINDQPKTVTEKAENQRDISNRDQVLQYKTYKNIIPQGKPRVYFCCHRDDFDKYFEPITDELLDIQQNAAIWYRDPKQPFPNYEQFLEDLELMQLFVVPVTSKFLNEDDPARTVELELADEKHIPVLFLMQEKGLESDFNTKCKERHFLDKAALEEDQTALSYQEKLQKLLKEILIGDELAKRIRDAFAAYIFLSYRKVDRSEAQRIMRMIHNNEACRDIAIWYDEFLTPGENFNVEIEQAMKKSRLFALVVTPNLLQNPNYVMTKEYPDARKLGKDIFPLEAVSTDMDELAALYENIEEYGPSGDAEKINNRLHKLFVDIASSEMRNDPEHNYLIGLAYLSGIDVEKNTQRAVEMIKGAANDGLPEAYEKLVRMYYYGDGVKEDELESYKWQKAYVTFLTENKGGYNEERWAKICEEYTRMGEFLINDKDYLHAELCYDRVLDHAKELEENNAESANYWMAMAYEKIAMAKINGAKWRRKVTPNVLYQGRILLEEAVKYNEKAAAASSTVKNRREVSMIYTKIGDLCRDEAEGIDDENEKKEKLFEAETWYQKSFELDRELVKEDNSPRMRRSLMLDYERIAGIAFSTGYKNQAKRLQEKYLEIAEGICQETGSVESYDDYACGCRFMMAYVDPKEAIGYLEKFIEIYKELSERTNEMKYTLNLIWAERALENMKSRY